MLRVLMMADSDNTPNGEMGMTDGGMADGDDAACLERRLRLTVAWLGCLERAWLGGANKEGMANVIRKSKFKSKSIRVEYTVVPGCLSGKCDHSNAQIQDNNNNNNLSVPLNRSPVRSGTVPRCTLWWSLSLPSLLLVPQEAIWATVAAVGVDGGYYRD